MKASFYETYYPGLFFAGMLADEITDGLKYSIDDGLYVSRRKPGRKRTEKLLRKLSKQFHLVVTANILRRTEYRENRMMEAAGWQLVAPGSMFMRRIPYLFSIYGYPKERGAMPPALPEGVDYPMPDTYRRMVGEIRDAIKQRLNSK